MLDGNEYDEVEKYWIGFPIIVGLIAFITFVIVTVS